MNSTRMIALPLKEAEECDWTQPLQKFLGKSYGSYADFSEEIAAFNKLRSDITGISPDKLGKDTLFRYYGQLELLDLRFPIGIAGGVQTTFSWSNALDHSDQVSQHALAFEKASVLFNMAAVLSHIGCVQTDADLKVAYATFQCSAGILHFISENFLHAPSSDLFTDTVNGFKSLMIAQAQEVFVIRLLTESSGANVKHSLIAKLSKGCSAMYGTAHETLSKAEENGTDPEFSEFALLKENYYRSVSFFHLGYQFKDTTKYGSAIACMKQAQEALKDYRQFGGYEGINKRMSDSVKLQLDLLKSEIAILEKENDYIYHDIIPQQAPDVKAMEAAKPIPLDQQDFSSVVGKDLFQKVVPLSVHEQSSMYSEEMAKKVRFQMEQINEAEDDLKAFYDYLKLPISLDEAAALIHYDAGSNRIDPKLVAMAEEVSADTSREKVQSLKDLRASVYQTLQKCESLLQQEESQYEKSRATYRDKWAQQPSYAAGATYKEELTKVKKSLVEAAGSDSKTLLLIEPYGPELQLLGKGSKSADFLRVFGEKTSTQETSLLDIDDEATEKADKNVAKARAKIRQMALLTKERMNTFKDMKEKTHQDDITQVLVLSKNASSTEVFAKELEKYSPYEERIESASEKQESLKYELKVLMSDILSNPTVKANREARDGLTTSSSSLSDKYTKAYNAWMSYCVGLDYGLDFYNRLQRSVEMLHMNIEAFTRTRKSEGTSLVHQISDQETASSFGNLSLGENPPKLPPKGNDEASRFYQTPSAYDPSLYSKFG